MFMPRQAKPIARNGRTSRLGAGVVPSDSIGCSLCKVACQALPPIAKEACLIACDKFAC